MFAKLTTPVEVNEQIRQFSQSLSKRDPIFLDCKPEQWSRQSCCDTNVEKYIEEHGGEVLCGYRIWYSAPDYIEGERHAVWTDGRQIRDVSFCDTGETRILFVPDDLGFDDAPKKIRYAFGEADQKILAQYEKMESKVSRAEMPAEQAWAIMPSYERWVAGDRMPNIIPIFGQTENPGSPDV